MDAAISGTPERPQAPLKGSAHLGTCGHPTCTVQPATTPQRYVATSTLRERKGRIYLDYLRNGRGATAVGAYSPRARAGAPVSTPLGWDELSPNLRPSHFAVDNLPTRLRHLAQDPWADIGRVDQVLPGRSSARRRRRA